MTQYLSQERLFYLLVWAFLLGVLLGAVYQIFRIRRAAFTALLVPRWISVIWLNIEDFLFLVAAGCAVTVLFYATVGGVLRIMAIPVLGLGLLVWRKTLGRLIDGATQQILRLLAWILRWIRRAIVRPIFSKAKAFGCRIRQMIRGRINRHRRNRLWKIAKQETHRYEKWLEQILLTEGGSTLVKPKGKHKG